jgi:hypothetical protein
MFVDRMSLIKAFNLLITLAASLCQCQCGNFEQSEGPTL